MPIFSVYNLDKKHYVGEFQFNDYIEAEKEVKKRFGEGFVAKVNALRNKKILSALIKSIENDKVEVLRDDFGNIAAYVHEGVFYHCGNVTLNQIEMLLKSGREVVMLDKPKFVKTLNELLETV